MFLKFPVRTFIVVTLLASVGTLTATAKEAAPTRVAANNTAMIKTLTGKLATVHGKVKSTSVSKSGIHFVNFYSSDVVAVCFKENVSKFQRGGPAKELKDKDVEITGKIELFKNKPQIKIVSPDQVKLKDSTTSNVNGKTDNEPDGKKTFSLSDVRVDKKTPSLSDVKVGASARNVDSTAKSDTFQLKQTGKLTWESPAGLRYSGKDAEGLTRVEHVLRHAADQPRRVGSHGVFDGGNDVALATVDEAWRLAKQRKIKAKNQGHTSAYTIPMGRRVGYLGGQNGARRNKPALSKVFIVVRTNTSDVITAFPK